MYDLIIIGAGPAGMAASIYASRYKLNHLVIANQIGGMAVDAHEIRNYPGFKSISGKKLMEAFGSHVQNLGAEIRNEKVVEIKKELISAGKYFFEITTSTNRKYRAKALILALGTKQRKLNIEGEDKFIGRGISYCAVCDAPFFKDKIVGVVGGSDSAATAALLLAEYAQKVFLIYRKEKINLRCQPVLIDELEKNPKIEMIFKTNIIKIKGENKVEAIEIDTPYENKNELKLDGLFIEIGSMPLVNLAQGIGVNLDEENYIQVDENFKTNVDGVFAAGDVTAGSAKFRQIITAASEGAIAAASVYEYLRKL